MNGDLHLAGTAGQGGIPAHCSQCFLHWLHIENALDSGSCAGGHSDCSDFTPPLSQARIEKSMRRISNFIIAIDND